MRHVMHSWPMPSQLFPLDHVRPHCGHLYSPNFLFWRKWYIDSIYCVPNHIFIVSKASMDNIIYHIILSPLATVPCSIQDSVVVQQEQALNIISGGEFGDLGRSLCLYKMYT